mmetsp:Transcript_13414/g.20343  ORF Transcript_13414/g.20343 Transcript_13414/m.20343 type:complete len:327 (+) Transcript_13414:208-1188(+)|eukprot:CAMPEP_0203669516 /NCGR_PEP_ID=MMETSP0090-20130426/5865_1 /ASSEMBLY_ACC=CAM_ASM_001088 /TAXON_ID=426623 /ORGANISM="Chaetoceros affinis, Strain CCMP159" /LENGTH=326 /DNA_ID=CAMNT_0050534219 /DNA_START=206 /DNA_END=1186 /DNA_ORIENTATION=-
MTTPDKNNNDNLQLVPEIILKKKHDMDEMKARRTAQQILHPKGNNKVFRRSSNSSSKSSKKVSAAVKIMKPETILARARSQRNHSIRYKRVLKKGMMKRASDKQVVKKKKVDLPDGSGNKDPMENEEDEDIDVNVNDEMDTGNKNTNSKDVMVDYASNSVGSKLVFVVRIRDPNGMPKNVKRILTLMKLKSVNEGVFLKYDERTRKQLHLIEPWVTYGIPSKGIISDLIHRRGHGKIDGKRIPLSDNTVIERELGKKTDGEVICVQDIVEELYSAGKQFQKVNQFLWTFQLAAARSKFQKQKLNFKDGGDYGDRGEEMDDLVRQML